MNDKKTIGVYNSKAGQYANLHADAEIHASLRKFMELPPKQARILDWGCGPGTHSMHMRDGLTPN